MLFRPPAKLLGAAGVLALASLQDSFFKVLIRTGSKTSAPELIYYYKSADMLTDLHPNQRRNDLFKVLISTPPFQV